MTALNVSLSPTLQAELAQPGIWAYAVYFDSGGNNPTWTSLVINGAVQQAGTIPVSLPATMVGGKIYFIVQSQDASQPYNLPGLITSESRLNWANANTYDFRYDSFEVTLQNSPFDAGNLTSVNGFGLPMEVSIPYQNGTSASVGYGITGSALVGDINNINTSNTYAYTYTSGPLSHHFRMALSPAESLSLGSNGPFKAADWSQYVERIAASLSGSTPANIILSGQFNGAPDAGGVWHNGGYFAYQLRWDGTNFWLDPLQSSQIGGHIQLTPTALQNSIYSTLGTANIYADPADPPYLAGMNTGANNQWGKVLSEFLTGFTGGFYLNHATSPNSQVTGLVDLNQNLNWDPNYAFTPLTPRVAYQTSDPYSQIFYAHSNSYGSGYSDALMSQYAVGGPLISVYDPVLQTNVRHINLTIYSDGEMPQGYVEPAIHNYIAPGLNGYDLPNPANIATNITLNFASNVAGNAGVVPDRTATITLNILTSDAGGTPTWSTVTFNGNTAGSFGLWQNWNIKYDSTSNSYSAVPFSIPVSQPAGTMLINQFPVAAGENSISWYQIGVGNKTFNLYVTTSSGQFENPNYAGQQGALAVDGLATVTPQQSTAPTISTFAVNFAVGDAVTYDPSLVVANTANVSTYSFPITPFAPVAGTLSSGHFTALPHQTSPVSNTITTTDADIAFAWTGANNDPNTVSWIAHYTNKIDAGDIARVSITSSSGSLFTAATADIDGKWQTGAVHLGAGTYTVSVTEYLSTDTHFTTPLSPTSNTLTLTVAPVVGRPGNHAPAVTAADLSATKGQAVIASSLFTASDGDNDTITAYQFYDNTPGGTSGHFVINGVIQPAYNPIDVSATQLAQTTFQPGVSGSDDLWVRAYDGIDWSAWKEFHVTVPPNHAPSVAASDVHSTKDQLLAAASLFSVADTDHDAITAYTFYDDSPAATSGYFVVNGVAQAAKNPIAISAADLAQTTFHAAMSGSDDLYVQAFDGSDWSAWKQFHVTVPANHAPVTTVSDHSLRINDWSKIASWISFTDADNDAALQYQFWNGDASPSAAKFWSPVSGVQPALNTLTVSAADLGNIWIGGATAAGSETMWVRAFDGLDWSNWTPFSVTTEPNHAPVVNVDDQSLAVNGWSKIAPWISSTDADGDAPTQYQFWYGDTSLSAAKFWSPAYGNQPALNPLTVSAAEVANIWAGGGTAPATETMWVRASDGLDWSNWESFHLIIHA
jgi:hypothetical protein